MSLRACSRVSGNRSIHLTQQSCYCLKYIVRLSNHQDKSCVGDQWTSVCERVVCYYLVEE